MELWPLNPSPIFKRQYPLLLLTVKTAMTEDRFIDIETKLTAQDDALDSLSQTVYRQQKQIDELERLCAALASQLVQVREAASPASSGHEPPPHY
jgi:SlyX protein